MNKKNLAIFKTFMFFFITVIDLWCPFFKYSLPYHHSTSGDRFFCLCVLPSEMFSSPRKWSLTTTLRFLVAFLFFLAFVITAVMLDRKGALTVVSWYLGVGQMAFGENGAMVVIFGQKEPQLWNKKTWNKKQITTEQRQTRIKSNISTKKGKKNTHKNNNILFAFEVSISWFDLWWRRWLRQYGFCYWRQLAWRKFLGKSHSFRHPSRLVIHQWFGRGFPVGGKVLLARMVKQSGRLK